MGCDVSARGGLKGHQGSGMYKGKRENKDLITLTYLTNCCIGWPDKLAFDPKEHHRLPINETG